MFRQVALMALLLLVGCGQSEPLPTATRAPTASPEPSINVTSTPSIAPPPTTNPASTASPPAYALSCGPMEQTECEARAAAIATQYAPKKIVSIRFTSTKGDMQAEFSDGTAVITIID
jgi:hypothetical protein